MGAAITPKGSPPATSPYAASEPWIMRLAQGFFVLSSNQPKKGVRIAPPTISYIRLFMKPPNPPRSEPMPSMPRLELPSSSNAADKTDFISGSTFPRSITSQLITPSGVGPGMSSISIGAPFVFVSNKATVSPAVSHVPVARAPSRFISRSPPPAVSVPPGTSGSTCTLIASLCPQAELPQSAHGSGGASRNPPPCPPISAKPPGVPPRPPPSWIISVEPPGVKPGWSSSGMNGCPPS